MITSVVSESQVIEALDAIKQLGFVHGEVTRLRVEHPGD